MTRPTDPHLIREFRALREKHPDWPAQRLWDFAELKLEDMAQDAEDAEDAERAEAEYRDEMEREDVED